MRGFIEGIDISAVPTTARISNAILCILDVDFIAYNGVKFIPKQTIQIICFTSL